MHNFNEQQQQYCMIQQQQLQSLNLSPERQQQHILHQMNQQNKQHFATTSTPSQAILKIENKGVSKFKSKFNF